MINKKYLKYLKNRLMKTKFLLNYNYNYGKSYYRRLFKKSIKPF